mmetsp:Transcript_64295/g.184773  ORF Transcript_64295/g.184773 Transcript_64295/m.184773 type:complete len:221 (-) Transcript_64295:287-949(-)
MLNPPIELQPMLVEVVLEASRAVHPPPVAEVCDQGVVQLLAHPARRAPVRVLAVPAPIDELRAVVRVHAYHDWHGVPTAALQAAERVVHKDNAIDNGPPVALLQSVPVAALLEVFLLGARELNEQLSRNPGLDQALQVANVLATRVLPDPPLPPWSVRKRAHRCGHGREVVLRVPHGHHRPLVKAAALHRRPMEEAPADGTGEVRRHSPSARGLAEEEDA